MVAATTMVATGVAAIMAVVTATQTVIVLAQIGGIIKQWFFFKDLINKNHNCMEIFNEIKIITGKKSKYFEFLVKIKIKKKNYIKYIWFTLMQNVLFLK